jgi:hypothetical protein
VSLFRTQFSVSRPTGSFVKGKWVVGVPSSLTIWATVQPLKGMDLQLVPEGRRNSQAVKVYTKTQLQIGQGTTNADILNAFGLHFEIITVEPWQSHVIDHYKCIGVALP